MPRFSFLSRFSRPRTIFDRRSRPETARILDTLRKETVGGIILVLAAAVAIFWANSPFKESYFALRDFEFGPAALNLHLSLGTWAADGLLAVFFFLVGLELKREFVTGDLRNPATAVVPVLAAFGGVVVPALIYSVINFVVPINRAGWAIPTATDIAFAVAVLAIIGSKLPSALRIFLLTLAVIDDLIAIVIIAIFYATDLNYAALFGALIPIAIYWIIANRFQEFFHYNLAAAWLILLPLGAVTWVLLHTSGIHATISGVVLGLAVPVFRSSPPPGTDISTQLPVTGLAEAFEHRFRPLSTGVAVPIFAFFSAGVDLGGMAGLQSAMQSHVALGVIGGLILGKPIGILLTVVLLTRLTGAELDPAVKWIDLTGVTLLAGIGFTVSLLITGLSFPGHAELQDQAKVAVITASLLASILASLVLVPRNRFYKQRVARQD